MKYNFRNTIKYVSCFLEIQIHRFEVNFDSSNNISNSSDIFFRSEEIESFHGTLQEELNLLCDGHIDLLLLFHLKSSFDKISKLHLIFERLT